MRVNERTAETTIKKQELTAEVTRRKKAEAAVRETDQKYRTLFDSNPHGIAITTLDGEIVDVDQDYQDMVGYTLKELEGTNFRELTPKKWHKHEAQAMKDFMSEGYGTFEKEYIRKDGTIFPVSLSAWLIRDGQGNPAGIGAFLEDITERKQAEEALRRSEENFRALLQNSSDIIQVVDSQGIIRYVSPSVQQILGYRPEELVGRPSIDVVHPDDLQEVARGFEEAFQKPNVPIIVECRCKHKDGTWRVIEGTGVNRLDNPALNGFVSNMRDITEWKRVEKTLEESEEKYRTQFEQVLDAIFIADAETGILVDCNQAACKLVGRKKSEFLGQHQRILHPRQKTNGDVTRTFKQHLGEKEGKVVETQVITKKGEIKEVAIKANVIELRGKKLLQGIFRDVTERKQWEDMLRKLEEDWRHSFNSLEDVMLIIDKDYNIENINAKGLALLNKSREEVIGRKCYKVISGADNLPEYCPCRQSLKTKKAASIDRYEKRFDRYFSIRTSPVFDENGEITKFVDLRHDITNRKRSEEALQEAKTRFETLFETANELIITTDVEGWILRLNKEVEKLSGHSKKELIGKSILEIAYPEDRDKYVQFWQDILNGLSPHYELRTISKTGNVSNLLASGNAIKKDGNIVEIQYNAKDITEGKQAEEKLRESEGKYRTILESMTEGYYEIDLAGNLAFFNDSSCQILGYTRDEMMGMNNRKYMDEENARKVYRIFNEVYRTGKPCPRADWESIRKDGTKLSISSSVSLITDSQGKPIGFRGLSRDITEQKKAAEELRESEGKYRTILESVIEGYYEVDLAGNFTFVNDSICHNIGYSRDEMMGMNNRDYMDEQTARKVLERYAEVYTTGQPARGFDFEIIRKDGTKLFISVSISLMTDSKGEPTGFRGVVRDITEEKQAEEDLRKSEERYRSLFETATDGIFTMDLKTRFTSGNKKAEEMCGYSRDELLGEYATLILPEEEIPRMADVFKKVLRGETDTYETRIITKNGDLLPVEVTSSPVEIDGEIIGTLGMARDITERKKAEEELRRNEEKYRQLTEEINDAIYTVDQDGNVTYVSPVIEWLIGYSPSEIMGRSFAELLHEEDLPRAIEGFERTLSGHSTEGEYRFHTKSGEIRWMGISNRPTFDGDSVVGARGTMTDITERKLAEQESEEARTRFEDLFESANELIITTDTEGWILHVNKEVERFSSYSKKELIGQSILKIAYPEDTPKYIQFWKDILDGLTPRYHLRGFSKTGDISHLLASASVVKKDGNIVEIQYNAKDITEEKQAEENLRESERKYRTILENMTDGYFEVDIAGNFTFFNDSYCEILGYTKDEMMGMNNRKYMDKENARKVYRTFNKVYTTGKPARGFDGEVIRKDGTKRFTEASISLVRNAQGEPVGFRGVVRDTTERKQMEAERDDMEQRAQLASRLSVVGEMASGIVHEINNPLTSVIGFAEMLTHKDLPEDAREYATIINNEGKRVASIAGRLLNFARHQKPEIVYTDINKLIEDTLELQTYEMTTGNIKVTAKLAPHLPRTMADPGQLQQVFLNITLNARAEMRTAHGGGKLSVKTEAIDSTIRISIKDDGPGIPKENLKRIFNPFFTTRKAGEGTGLGLSICQGIINSHNGKIYAESTLGKGATFIIELPVVARQKNKAGTAGANGNNVWR